MNPEFNTQMNFLKSYIEVYEQRKEAIIIVETRLSELKSHYDKYNELIDKRNELKRENRSDEKLIISMNDMVMRNTGEPITSGPLFDKENIKNEQQTNN